MSRLVLPLGCFPLFIAPFMLITITLSPVVWGIIMLSIALFERITLGILLLVVSHYDAIVTETRRDVRLHTFGVR
jgi:hypothetical protein